MQYYENNIFTSIKTTWGMSGSYKRGFNGLAQINYQKNEYYPFGMNIPIE